MMWRLKVCNNDKLWKWLTNTHTPVDFGIKAFLPVDINDVIDENASKMI